MKYAELIRMLGLFSVLGFAAAVVGCGTEAQQADVESAKQARREAFKSKTAQNNAKAAPKGRSTTKP
jgi:Pyruvate/2-oxoacid:ferredoxin oxidoreductase gamma subunit